MSSKIVCGVFLTFSITKGRPIPRGVKKKISVHKKLTEQIKFQNIRSLHGFQHSIYPNQIFGEGKGEHLREEHAYIYIQWFRQKFRILM
jgi:hypothetical protein